MKPNILVLLANRWDRQNQLRRLKVTSKEPKIGLGSLYRDEPRWGKRSGRFSGETLHRRVWERLR
jgi:hypothetical protein